MDRAALICQHRVQFDPALQTEMIEVSRTFYGAKCTLDDGTVAARTWWLGDGDADVPPRDGG